LRFSAVLARRLRWNSTCVAVSHGLLSKSTESKAQDSNDANLNKNKELDNMKIDLSRLKLIGHIQNAISAVLPDFIEKNLKDPEVRKAIVRAADAILLTKYPAAALIPSELRQTIIEKQLEIAINVLLGPDEAFAQMAHS
jgi:hypothetical protein